MTKDEASSPARLIIADDHDLVREGIRVMLAKEPDLVVVGEAENGLEALELCRSLSPDLVLMDVRVLSLSTVKAYMQRIIAKLGVLRSGLRSVFLSDREGNCTPGR